jgi:hypothetical protein
MNTKQAQHQGASAFKNGKSRAPALNQAFMAQAFADSVDSIAAMRAYIDGWTYAMLADGAPADMPSVMKLAEIEAA